MEVLYKQKIYSLQFLPDILSDISVVSKIIHNGKNLKTSYLIDIIHNLILKYFFKKDNYFRLNSLVLKEKYGHLYNYYIDYLLVNEIIYLEKNYLVGSNSRIYSLSNKVLSNKINRYRNKDKILLKKLGIRHFDSEINNNTIINENVKIKLINDLYSVSIQYDRSIFYLTSISFDDVSIFERNRYSVDCINENHIFYHFDNYGRMHTNFTILKSFIRKNCLLIDGEETWEIDISNSQPFLLSKLIKMIDSKWVDKDELELFSILVDSGNFYQYLINKTNISSKGEAKDLTYRVLFGKNRNSKYDKMFILLFPTIHYFIKLYKKEHGDYRYLAYTLQKMESNLIYNDIIKNIMIINSDIKIITVHDSIIVQKKYKNIVEDLFLSTIYSKFEDKVFNN